MSDQDDLLRLMDCLHHPEHADPDRELARRVLADGHRVLATRRRVRTAIMGLVGLALFGGGFVTHALTTSSRPDAVSPVPVRRPRAPSSDEGASAIEIDAELASADHRGTLYRRAGDAWLEEGDTVAATRCYRRHLELQENTAQVSHADDSWLLLALRRTLDD